MKKNYFKNLMQVSLLLGAAFVISSCDDVIGQEDNPVASYLQWDASVQKSYTLKIGQTATVKAVAVSSAVIVYESGDEEVAKVNPVTGEITAVGVGKTVIKAVVTGASSAGQSVFQTTSVEVPIEVKDGNAKLTRVKDEVVEYTANVDSVIDLTKLFTAYPEVGTGAQKSTVAYSILGKNDKKTPAAQDLATINAAEVKILANGTIRDWYAVNKKKGTDISDTLYVEATLTPNDTKEYKVAKPTDVVDTIMVIINKSIAFINKDGKREILTADKYKTPDFSQALEAGTYYIPAGTAAALGNIAVKGDVTLIYADGYTGKNSISATSISDQTDNATLNIFGEAIDLATPAKGKYRASNPTITINAGTNGDAISNFKEINFYTGTITANTDKANSGAIVKVKNLNVFGGTLTAKNTASGYAISLLEGGKLTVKGGSVTATGKGSDTDRSYGVIGDVEVAKGTFQATSDYRAVKGSLTAGEGLEFVESNDPTDDDSWTKITGTTSNAKGVKSQAKK
jgi:hypothetical protein